ncbi:MAG: PA0069 family radical SAM protein [Saprospiraceae bacterium]|nr:PA0069 family radical SAM protein [Saprospiraceae bacterium]
MEKVQAFRKGRGAQYNSFNRFSKIKRERDYTDEDWEEMNERGKTEFIEVFPKTIVNKVQSPDIGMMYSMNPYQGCEHGCVYCYARNTHEYWGYSAGLDFEQKIMVKKSAPQLLAKHLGNPKWQAAPIMLSGNTDCYQPVERETEITRELLKTFYKYRHPVGIITKNALVERDKDILVDLAQHNLVRVTLSITSLKEDIRRKIEPRTASAQKKLKVMKELSDAGIPTQLMLGPIIPGLNNYEIFDVVKAAADHGASGMVFTVLHLNGHLGELFSDWVYKAFPLKADHILSLVKQVHGGQLNDSRWGVRKRGDGEIAKMIHRQVRLAKEINFKGRGFPPYNLELHKYHKNNQMKLF